MPRRVRALLGTVAALAALLMLPAVGQAQQSGATKRVVWVSASAVPAWRACFAKLRRPAIYQTRDFVEAGGLLSYGLDACAHYGRAAFYVDKILKGAKPADLPVELPSTFQLVINLKTARALGVQIPPSVLTRADRVIE
ncbi:MAG: hypothetical protein IT513_03285 [Burkholderiales bacterium]|nr:hypothetical protein [Burkholderiales bacterium]